VAFAQTYDTNEASSTFAGSGTQADIDGTGTNAAL